MRIKFLSVFAAAALLAACETAPDSSANAAGSGAVTSSTQPTTAAPAPAGPTPGTAEDFVVNVGDRVFFGFDKSDLTTEARTTLERQAFWLRKYPSLTVSIEGHADERGTREYNLALGERRANGILNYLIVNGASRNQIETVSYGEERPADRGTSEAAYQRNRRVEIVDP